MVSFWKSSDSAAPPERVQALTMTTFTDAKIKQKMTATVSDCTPRGPIIHDLYAELNSAYKSCIIRPREAHSEAVSGHVSIYLGLGVYGHGMCLHSLQ